MAASLNRIEVVTAVDREQAILFVAGTLDARSVRALGSTIRKLIDANVVQRPLRRIVVDLAGVRDCTDEAAAVLDATRRRAEGAGATFGVRRARDPVLASITSRGIPPRRN